MPEGWRDSKFQVANAQVTLMLPFLHKFTFQQVTSGHLGELGDWSHWFTRLGNSEQDGVPDEYKLAVDYSFFFLPQARRFLFPECEGLDNSSDLAEIYKKMRECNFSPGAVRDLAANVHHLAESGLTSRITWRDLTYVGQQYGFDDEACSAVGFEIKWVDAILFPQHVGVYMMHLVFNSGVETQQLADVLRRLRKNRTRLRLEIAPPEVVKSASGERLEWSGIADKALGPLASLRTRDGLLVEETIGTTFKSVVVAQFDASTPGKSLPPFLDEMEAATFALATGHALRGRSDLFTPRGMEGLRAKAIQSWDDWRVFGYDEGLCFGILAASPAQSRMASRVALNAEWAYSLCHSLAVAQFTRQQLLFQKLVALPADLGQAMSGVEEFEREYIRYRRLLWFPIVTSAPTGAPVYALSRETMSIPSSQAWLDNDIALIRDFLATQLERSEVKSASRTARVLEILTLIAVPTGLAVTTVQVGLWEENVAPLLVERNVEPVAVVAATVLLFVLLYVALVVSKRWGGRRKDI